MNMHISNKNCRFYFHFWAKNVVFALYIFILLCTFFFFCERWKEEQITRRLLTKMYVLWVEFKVLLSYKSRFGEGGKKNSLSLCMWDVFHKWTVNYDWFCPYMLHTLCASQLQLQYYINRYWSASQAIFPSLLHFNFFSYFKRNIAILLLRP